MMAIMVGHKNSVLEIADSCVVLFANSVSLTVLEHCAYGRNWKPFWFEEIRQLKNAKIVTSVRVMSQDCQLRGPALRSDGSDFDGATILLLDRAPGSGNKLRDIGLKVVGFNMTAILPRIDF